MNLELRKQGSAAVIAVEGRVDTVTAPDLEERILEWVDQGESHLVLDLSDVEYVSSAGLRALLVIAKTAKSCGGGLACCRLQDMVKRVFEVSGFTAVIPVYATLEEALPAR